MTAEKRQLSTSNYWDQRATRPGLAAVMWPNLAFSEAVDRRQKQIILSMFPVLTGKHVLDLGCGTGRLSLFLAERGARVTGTDFSQAMIASANEALAGVPGADARFRHASLRDLGAVGDRFDCLLSVCCLALGGRTRESFQEDLAIVASLVERGGYILLMEPIHRWWPLRRVCPLPVRDWIAEFERHGCRWRRRDHTIFLPFKFPCGQLPLPAGIVRLLFTLGESLMRAPGVGSLMSDYTVLLFQRT